MYGVKDMQKLATKMGIKNYIEHGRIKFEADHVGDLVRMWALVGADVVTQGKYSKAVYLGGEFVAAICHMRGFAYSYTSKD